MSCKRAKMHSTPRLLHVDILRCALERGRGKTKREEKEKLH